MTGVRTELVFERAEGCPAAQASTQVPSAISDITWTEGKDGTVKEQVTTDGSEDLPSFDPVFDYGSEQVYEFERPSSDPCICEHIQQSLGPVREVFAEDGDLHVRLHTTDVDALRELLVDLREDFGGVSVEYLVRSVDAEDGSELVPVDMRQLTDRQREVLETAHEMGYFEYPRDANATEVSRELGIEPSTFSEHLAAAQGKLLDELMGS
ncbi:MULTISPECIES: helix-turn-helix domain-containing protein [Salinibaculum]|uniref:helix-turn-helix domain-containing protein n=1 Tax=Salinibaculum TaxID=2732368 RepID=UPI0030CFD68A